MGRRRAERRKVQRAATRAPAERSPVPAAAGARFPVSVVAIVAATLLAFLCIAPMVLRGNNPYPAAVLRYWSWGAPVVIVAAAVAALAPVRWFDVSRIRAILDRPSPRAIALLVAALATGLSVTFAVSTFRRSATTSDELAQLWHARMLLTGRFSLPTDPNPEFFALENVIDIGRWYSQFPIGGPLVLSVGAVLGMPWLVNPLLCGVAAVALYHFARRAFGETQGRAIAIMFSLTPMVLLMAGTWMNHVSVLALAMIALASLIEWERATSTRRRLVFAGAIGICLGAMATIRPVDALIVSVVVGVFQLWVVRRDLSRLIELAVQGVAGAVAVAPLLYANAVTTGRPLRFGYDVMWGAGHRIGFHVDPYGVRHTVGRAFEYLVTYVGQLNISLAAWPIPVLAVAILALASIRRMTRWDALLLALFAAQALVYASYSLVGQFLGPRFLYTAVPTIVILVARMSFLVGERFGDRWGRAAVAFTMACIAITWCVPTEPFNAWGLARQAASVRRNMRVDVPGAVREASVRQGIVFVREPFGGRLLRRLWGAGITRSDAARLLQSRDACSLLEALRAAEADTMASPGMKATVIIRGSVPFAASARQVRVNDASVLISAPESVTPACRKELEDDVRFPPLLFGPALPHEPIDAQGRIDGDVIYVADLGDRNEVLRRRFGHRPWYRLVARDEGRGEYHAELVPY